GDAEREEHERENAAGGRKDRPDHAPAGEQPSTAPRLSAGWLVMLGWLPTKHLSIHANTLESGDYALTIDPVVTTGSRGKYPWNCVSVSYPNRPAATLRRSATTSGLGSCPRRRVG